MLHKMPGPLRDHLGDVLDQCDGPGPCDAELVQVGQRVVQRGLRPVPAHHHRLVAHVLQCGHHVERRGQVVVAIKAQAQAVVAFVVVRVVHQDVEHHAPEKLFAQGFVPVRVGLAQQYRGQRAIAFGQACRRQRGLGRNAMHAQVQCLGLQAVKPLDRQRMAFGWARLARCNGQHTRGGDMDTRLRCQRHGGVFDEGRVHGVVEFAELDHAGAVVGLQQRLGPGPAQRHAGLHQALDFGGDRGLGLHVFHRPHHGVQVAQLRVRPDAAGNVVVGRCRYAQSAEAVVPREQQHLQDRQACRAVDVADDALAPAVGAGIVDGAGRTVLVACAEHLAGQQRQVFAQRKLPPVCSVVEGGAVGHQLRQADGACQNRVGRVDQRPHVQRVLRLVGARGDVGHAHGRTLLWPAMRAAKPAAVLLVL